MRHSRSDGGCKPSPAMEALIERCLRHEMNTDALNLAELHYQQVQSDNAALLFARCLHANGFTQQAMQRIKSHGLHTAELRYFFAKYAVYCKKPLEAQAVLRNNNKPEELHPVFKGTEQEPFALNLYATVMDSHDRPEEAVKQYQRSITSEPLLWSSIKRYCELGGKSIVPTPNGYDIPFDSKITHQYLEESPIVEPALIGTEKKKNKAPSRILPRRRLLLDSAKDSPLKLTPRSRPTRESKRRGLKTSTPNEKETKKVRRHGQPLSLMNKGSLCGSNTSLNSLVIPAEDTSVEAEPMDVENHEPRESAQRIPIFEPELDWSKNLTVDTYYQEIYGYLIEMTGIQVNLSRYNFTDSIAGFDRLDPKHREWPLSLELHARVYFEQGNYSGANEIFERLRSAFPYRVQGLEAYSSSLWQSQEQTKLAALAKELTDNFRHRAETWCAAGNLYSLEKQCPTAVECFDRATRAIPNLGYAHSLLGYELIEVGHFERAEQAFRQALQRTPQDYRPYLGLGMIEQKRAKMRRSLTFVRQAIERNPSNIILQCHLAFAEQANGDTEHALRILDSALAQDQYNSTALFHKARMLSDVRRYEEAKVVADRLRRLYPSHSHVLYLLARIHRKLGDKHDAMVFLNLSAQVDPRGEQSRAMSSTEGFEDDDIDPNDSTRLARP